MSDEASPCGEVAQDRPARNVAEPGRLGEGREKMASPFRLRKENGSLNNLLGKGNQGD